MLLSCPCSDESVCGVGRRYATAALSGASRQLSQRESLWRAGQVHAGRPRPDRTQKGGPCYRGQARLRTTSQALRASSPSRGASGETVHFAGTAKASPTRGGGIAQAMTERLYEGKPDHEPLQRRFTQVWEDTTAPRGAGYLAKREDSDISSCKNALCQGGNLPISWHSDPTLPKGAECQVGKLAKYNVDILLNSHFAI